ncbi:hypothetical protein N7532_002421 [Penicillium argentinense]|uniref:Clr5 domain-containing protein n=1 Tax=Penicillium argentinense TaxID=1131581 RepID=A0A9W9G0I0_9EURO|nr:uncharacterized protein N7532_002421 [Penicillium argentinense]KAJ5109776.1 hypothetical protein N7532_002421 [Penicillium argentinense]
MKTSISSDVWEKKKALIAKLYMEEEWPLKQVIKQIRSDDFNPSETQLRSRLKKWRVTKPSRQTRKKPQGATDDESDKDRRSSTASPRHRKSSPLRDCARHTADWVAPTHSLYGQPQIASQQLTPSPSGDPSVHSFTDGNPVTSSFEHPAQTSPVGQGLMVNTSSVVTPSYSSLPLSPESCLPSPGSSAPPAMAQWSPRSVSVDLGLNPTMHQAPWYSVPFEPVTPPAGVPHSAPLPPSVSGYMVPPAQGVFPPEFAHYPGEDYQTYDAKPWKRTMSLQYDYGHGRPEHSDRKYHHSYHQPPPGIISMPPSQPVMCAPMMPYST